MKSARGRRPYLIGGEDKSIAGEIMLILERKLFIFDTKTVYFCDYPSDVDGCDAVTFICCKNEVDVKGFVRRRDFTAVINLTQDLDLLWRNMDKTTRYQIRRAEGEGVKTNLNQDYDEFHQINKAFRRSKGFGSILNIETPNTQTMKKYGTLFTTQHSGEILAGHLYLEDGNHIRLWLSASKRLEANRDKAALIGRANRLLHWEAIKHAKENGIKEFDWGGMWPKEEAEKDKLKYNINSFKLRFGAEVVPCYVYERVYSKRYGLAKDIYSLASQGLRKVRAPKGRR